jgi:hypothetical protein
LIGFSPHSRPTFCACPPHSFPTLKEAIRDELEAAIEIEKEAEKGWQRREADEEREPWRSKEARIRVSTAADLVNSDLNSRLQHLLGRLWALQQRQECYKNRSRHVEV